MLGCTPKDEKVVLCENIHLPHRQRWGFMFYVAARTQSKTKVSITQAIEEFREAFDLESSEATLRKEYYRLSELHVKCLKDGI